MMDGCPDCERLKAERLKLDRRIHNQRVALRQNWMIVEQRADYARRQRCPTRMLEFSMKQNRRINELLRALNARVVAERGNGYRVMRVASFPTPAESERQQGDE